MSKFGLTKERYLQMMLFWHGNEQAVKDTVDDWGAERCNKGYDTFNFNGLDILQIEAIGDVGAYTDEEATIHAIANGVKIIPVEELPENFGRKYLGWIDTPENRAKIKELADKYPNDSLC